LNALKAMPRRKKREFSTKGMAYVKYLIEDEDDGNIACPAFPFPLIDYDDFEDDPASKPWQSAAERQRTMSQEPKEKIDHWMKLTNIILSKNEKPNIPLVNMMCRSKEEMYYWKLM
jgi:hypothetical protein